MLVKKLMNMFNLERLSKRQFSFSHLVYKISPLDTRSMPHIIIHVKSKAALRDSVFFAVAKATSTTLTWPNKITTETG